MSVIREIWTKFVKEKVGSALKLNQKLQKNKDKLSKALSTQNDQEMQTLILTQYYEMQQLNYKIKDIFILKSSKKCSEDQKDKYENKLDRWLDQYDQIIIKLGI